MYCCLFYNITISDAGDVSEIQQPKGWAEQNPWCTEWGIQEYSINLAFDESVADRGSTYRKPVFDLKQCGLTT